MEVVARSYAGKTGQGPWLSRLEVERWQWDFARDPDHPRLGQRLSLRTFTFENGPGRDPSTVRASCAL